MFLGLETLGGGSRVLGGSWVVISRIKRHLIWVISTLLLSPVLATHEAPPPPLFRWLWSGALRFVGSG